MAALFCMLSGRMYNRNNDMHCCSMIMKMAEVIHLQFIVYTGCL